MANSDEEKQSQTPPNSETTAEEDHKENDVVEEDENEDDEEPEPPQKQHKYRESLLSEHKSRMENLFRRLQREPVNLRVHDVIIKGNTKTKDSIIEAELEALKNASTMQELLDAAGRANARLQQLEIFDSVKITLDKGPPELHDTANVIVEVVETSSTFTAECGAYSKPAARSWTAEGTLKYKNWFGYGDLWDGSVAYGPNQTSEVSAGVFLPRVRGLSTPVLARASLLSQDWQEFSSYKERSLGFSLNLLSTKYHDLAYNLGWRTLTDPSQMSSREVRRQLGHSLLSSLKYTFKIDRRDSSMRPTKGHAFVSTTQIGGLAPDHRSLRFLRQEFDLRYALPFGFYRAALNFGISGGVLFPWGQRFLNKPSPLPERFFLSGDFSPVCSLAGPTSMYGFKTRGLGPSAPRRQNRGNSDGPGRDYLGGDLAVTAFADLSFDLPVKWVRELGVHGHVFAGAGNLSKLTENEFRNFSPQKFLESFRISVGGGVVVPTKLFRLEANYYYLLKQHEHDRGKTGFRFSFSPRF